MLTKKDPSNLGIAVIGLGRGKSHAKAAKRVRGGELLAVCDINVDILNPVAESLQVDAYTDYRELLKRDDINIISICTPSGMHCDMAIEVAKAGKHAIVEKPLDISLDKIDKAINFFDEKGLKLGCILQNRLEACNLRMKQAVEDGEFGKMILCTAHVKWYRTQEYYDKNGGWRGTWAMDGGGSLMNQSVHTIDLMQWIMGPVKSVIGTTGLYCHDIETEDLGAALIKFKNGALGTIVGSTAIYPGFDVQLEIHGQDGSAFMSGNKITSWKVRKETSEEIEKDILHRYGSHEKKLNGASDPTAISQDTTFKQVQDIVDAVRENRRPIIEGRDGRASVEIINAIYESAKSGKEVFLPLKI
jgi:UDP-N-acetyl-2-amino-2-deoxyglucuronate dehydrogenase